MRVIWFILLGCLTLCVKCIDNPLPSWSVASKPWPEELGNHRAVIEVQEPAEAVILDIAWRRHDPDPASKRFIIIESSTGDTVQNIYRYSVGNESCRIALGPVNKGIYHFYYLPYPVQTDWGFYDKEYLSPEKQAAEWAERNNLTDTSLTKIIPLAKLNKFEARTAFDSFYPMEIIPLASEKNDFFSKNSAEYLLFPEGRENPIRMKDEIPLRWIQSGPSGQFTAKAMKNEYYSFQVGLYAASRDLDNIKVEFSPLTNSNSSIPAEALSCFNTGGTGPYGNRFEKVLNVKKGHVQPLWIGIDIPGDAKPGIYKGVVTVRPGNASPRAIQLTIDVSGKVLADRGDSEPWRHSRLRWLNSTLGIDDKPVSPYKPIEYLGDNTYRLTDKLLKMDRKGFPGSVSAGDEILSGPMQFVVETTHGKESFSDAGNIRLLKNEPGAMSGAWTSASANFEISGIGIVESDGYFNYKLSLTALSDQNVKDIRLEIPFSSGIAEYIMGMGLPGMIMPSSYSTPWNGPQDSFWIGNPSGGLWCELRGGSYHGPLLNLYKPDPPASWSNNGRGGFRVKKENGVVRASAFTGEKFLRQGETIEFEWSFLITPVKKVNTRSQFADRYYHNGSDPLPSDSDISTGVKIVNLHHANKYNPHINYPFIAVDSMKWFINEMHSRGVKVKIYYTIRELTNYATEIWALRSLGDEILGYGKGGGYPWLREHFVTDYHPQWYQYFPHKSPDASVLSASGESRWYNYYIEGLAWLVRNEDIDGLYLDDVTYDRRTVKRIRKVLDKEKPGCILDLHSNTGFSIGPANQYAEFFPYIDKLWFGESFVYDSMSAANWLVETSGIPFGLMGDMLQGGGNRWRGMVYGMTVRYPWNTAGVNCDPRPVWKIWDEFGIESADMIGYWDHNCPVITGNPGIFATVYRKEGRSLVSVASWADKTTSFVPSVDWNSLGIDPSNAEIHAPYIKDFQEEKYFRPGEPITVGPAKGLLIYLEEKK